MTCVRPLLAAIAALFLAPLAAAQEPIEYGDLPVYGKLGPNATNDAPEAGFIVYGPFARQMYDFMTTPAQQDACTGGQFKQHGSGFNCSVTPDGEASCSFGYDYATGRMTPGPQTC